MGIVKLGKIEYETNEFRIANNKLFINGRVIEICEPDGVVQLKSDNTIVAELKSNGFTLIEGQAIRVWCENWVSVTGKVLKYWVESGKKFFNNTAKESLSKEKKMLRSKIPNKRRSIVTCSGAFNLVQLDDRTAEAWLKDSIVEHLVSHGTVSIQGHVTDVVAKDSLYISRK